MPKGDNYPDSYLTLATGMECPKCQLGDGLRLADLLEFGVTGWEHYNCVHCDTCGATFVGKDEGDWHYLRLNEGNSI